MDPVEGILRRLKLSDLRLLHAVAQWGGMAKAAAQLNISQPAVSKAVKSLEQTLGVRLLDRNAQGVELTDYGRALLKGCMAVFDELRQSVKHVKFLADPHSGELRIGCTEAGAAGFVPLVIERLSRQYPQIVFHVTISDAATLVQHDLPQRKVDLAIAAVPTRILSSDIQVEILYEDRHCVMAGKQNKWCRQRNIPLADLIHEPWILPPPENFMGVYVAEAFRAEGLEPPRGQVVSFSIPLCHHLLAAGRFLTMHPIVMARLGKYLPLTRVDVRFGGIPRSIGILTLKNRTLNPLAQLFIDCARDKAKVLAKVN